MSVQHDLFASCGRDELGGFERSVIYQHVSSIMKTPGRIIQLRTFVPDHCDRF